MVVGIGFVEFCEWICWFGIECCKGVCKVCF